MESDDEETSALGVYSCQYDSQRTAQLTLHLSPWKSTDIPDRGADVGAHGADIAWSASYDVSFALFQTCSIKRIQSFWPQLDEGASNSTG